MTFDSDNVYYLSRMIDDASIKNLVGWFLFRLSKKKKSDTLYLLVNSGGGWVFSGFAFIDLAMESNSQLLTLAVGAVDSMAIPIFLTGRQRIVSAHASVLFHEQGRSFGKDTRMGASEMRSECEGLSRSQKVYADFVSSRTNLALSPEEVIKMMKAEERIFAEEIVKLGIAHEILNQEGFPFKV